MINVAHMGTDQAVNWIEETLGHEFTLVRVGAERDPMAPGLLRTEVFLDAPMNVPVTGCIIQDAKIT